jgi:DNA invertase Pin-like site-specific DNA recombinase
MARRFSSAAMSRTLVVAGLAHVVQNCPQVRRAFLRPRLERCHCLLHELKERGCGFTSLGDGWCDTTSDVGRLVLAIMGGIAEFERELIRKRCQAGIERAKANGKQFGRPAVLDAKQRKRLAERYAVGETMAQLAREYGCGEATIWPALRPSARR